jgi:glycosyltransferase involved in cell wall biosynthesis
MACGTPVVATRNGGADDVLAGGKYGVLAGDDELAGVLVDLLQSSDRRSLLSRLALQRAPEYAITKVVEQYESLYAAVKDAA